MSLKLLERYDSLELGMLVGEQTNTPVTIPSTFTESTDKELLASITADKRTDKIIYAYSDSGISANNRNWSSAIMESISSQVVSKLPVGYLGHIKPQDYGYEFPEPQIVWFGSTTETLPAPNVNTTRLWLKGYMLPTATKLAGWIKNKAVDSISVYGKIQYVDNKGIMDINSIDLKSIDISRKLGEGLNSKIIGLYGEMSDIVASEMDATYDDVRRKLEKVIKSSVLDSLPVEFRPGSSIPQKPYVYVWVKQMFVNSNNCIVSVEYKDSVKVYEATYSVDKEGNVNITSDLTEVYKEEKYLKKTDGDTIKVSNIINTTETGSDDGNTCQPVEACEMNKGGTDMDKESIIKGLTFEDIKLFNPGFVASLKTAIASEMNAESEQKNVQVKASRLDEIAVVIGGEQENLVEAVKTVVQTNTSFVGEMSAIFAGEGETAVLTPEKIVEKAKDVVKENTDLKTTVENVAKAVDKQESETVVDAVNKTVKANKVNRNKGWVSDVNAKFTELAKGKDGKNPINETILEFVKDDFDAILDVKPEDISEEDWKDNAIAYLDNNFAKSVEKYSKRLSKVTSNSKAVGEMNAFANLDSSIVGEQAGNGSDNNEDPDVAFAKKMGYGN